MANPSDPLEKGGFVIDGRHGVHCSFHNTRKTGKTMETQSIEEAKSMSAMAAAAAHAQLAKAQQMQQMQQQQRYQQQQRPFAPPPAPFPPHPPTSYNPPLADHYTAPAPAESWTPPKSSELPPQFRCSIDGELMDDPVIAVDGYSYERYNLERYFRSHDVSPKTGQVLSNKTMMPNMALKEMIGNW
ncbi:hypothetical protein TrRE_jg3776, partial [Triparma retinervis]